MRIEDERTTKRLKGKLEEYSQQVLELPGIHREANADAFAFQLIRSLRRIRYIAEIRARPVSSVRCDPTRDMFDPIRAAILNLSQGHIDEAGWLVFLFTHFGRNLKSGFQLTRDVYGCLGSGKCWTWKRLTADPHSFRIWLGSNQSALATVGNTHRGFGNHRKYQSLKAWTPTGTGAAVESYATLIQSKGGHQSFFADAAIDSLSIKVPTFRILYNRLAEVASFGRTARFDYRTMIGKVGLAPITADSVYFQGATGPISGAKLLFLGHAEAAATASWLERQSDQLSNYLDLDKQVMEDSLCNWQKHPSTRVHFKG